MSPQIVLLTVKDAAQGEKIAQAVLTRRLAACVNIVPGVQSHYWWEGKLQSGSEQLLFIKTSKEKLGALKVLIAEKHSYECPEIIAIKPDSVEAGYLGWWREQVS